MDDIMVTHKSNFEVTKLYPYLKEEFGGLSDNRGNKHTYIGIDFHFSHNGEVQASQVMYLPELLQDFLEQLGLT